MLLILILSCFRWRAQKDEFERQILAEGAALAAKTIEAGRTTRPSRLNRDIAAAVISEAIGLWGRDSDCLDIANAILGIVPVSQTEPRRCFLPLQFP